MKHSRILLPLILLEPGIQHFGVVERDNIKYAVIDSINYYGDKENARQKLIQEQGYSSYILLS